MLRSIGLLLGVAIAVSACTWVKLTPEGADVAVLASEQVANCQRIGTTTVEVLDRTVLERDPEKVATELETLARNRVADRADTIVASTPVEDGRQTFVLYQCNPVD